jgi:hypothetical protein
MVNAVYDQRHGKPAPSLLPEIEVHVEQVINAA